MEEILRLRATTCSNVVVVFFVLQGASLGSLLALPGTNSTYDTRRVQYRTNFWHEQLTSQPRVDLSSPEHPGLKNLFCKNNVLPGLNAQEH